MPGSRGRQNGELVLNGYGVSVWEDESVPETDSGDGCPTMPVFCTITYTSKGEFYSTRISPQFKNWGEKEISSLLTRNFRASCLVFFR